MKPQGEKPAENEAKGEQAAAGAKGGNDEVRLALAEALVMVRPRLYRPSKELT